MYITGRAAYTSGPILDTQSHVVAFTAQLDSDWRMFVMAPFSKEIQNSLTLKREIENNAPKNFCKKIA